jgi:hypothetical protein
MIDIMIFQIGILLSAIYLLVWMRSVKKIILGSVVTGLALERAGSLIVPELYAETTMATGIGFVCVGAGGIADKVGYYFGYREGWFLMQIGFPFMVRQT